MIDAAARREHDFDLSTSYCRLGQANYQVGHVAAARQAFRKSLELSPKLVDDDPADSHAQRSSAYTFGLLGTLEKSADNFAEAIGCLQRSVEILENAERNGQITGQAIYLSWLQELRDALEDCRVSIKAIGDLDFTLSRPEKELPELLAIRSRVLARRGEHIHATRSADILAAIEPSTGHNLLLAAEGYASCAGSLNQSAVDGGISPDNQKQRNRYAERAVELLERARLLGLFNAAERAIQLETKPTFDALREREDFQGFLAGLWCSEANKQASTINDWTFAEVTSPGQSQPLNC